MAPWSPFLAPEHAVDLILLIILVEFALLSARRRYAVGRMMDIVFALAPGVCLLLALRMALTTAGWAWVAAFLAASFPIHIADLIRRRL